MWELSFLHHKCMNAKFVENLFQLAIYVCDDKEFILFTCIFHLARTSNCLCKTLGIKYYDMPKRLVSVII